MQAERERERGEASEKEHALNLQLRRAAAEADIMRKHTKASLEELLAELLAEMAELPNVIEGVRENGAAEQRKLAASMRRLDTLEKVGLWLGAWMRGPRGIAAHVPWRAKKFLVWRYVSSSV
jgi:hypothetical protein